MKRAGGLLAAVALAGCIPPGVGPPRPSENAPASGDVPRIDTEAEVFTTEQPVWDAQPVTASAKAVEGGRYTVQPGDTLRGIGAKTGAGSETLARVNHLEWPFILHAGDVLTVPAGRFHTVAAGESGIAIARAYAVPWRMIVEANALEEPFTLRVGQRLLIPGEVAPPPTSDDNLEAHAAAFRLDIDDILTGGEPAVEPAAPATPAIAAPAHFAGRFFWPAQGRIASSFGPKGGGQVNQGVEIAVGAGSSILAAGEGVVAFVGNNVAPVGGLILIKHGDGWISAYGHAATANVTRGQRVLRGQVLGKAGSGAAPLVFFQLRKNGIPVDPITQLPPRG